MQCILLVTQSLTQSLVRQESPANR